MEINKKHHLKPKKVITKAEKSKLLRQLLSSRKHEII